AGGSGASAETVRRGGGWRRGLPRARALAYPDQAWTLRAQPGPAWFAAHHGWMPWTALAASLAATLLLVARFRQMRLSHQLVERKVDARTAELAARTADMRRVFDNVDAGLVTLDYQGEMSGEASAALERWFGPREGLTNAIDYFGRIDPEAGEFLGLGLETLRDELMPLSVSLTQLPTEIRLDERVFEIAYLPFEESEGPRILLVANEITERVNAERRRAEQAELVKVFDRILHDKDGFLEFFADTGRLVSEVVNARSESVNVVARKLHTIKGNCGLFDLATVAGHCHRLEERITEGRRLLHEEERQALSATWQRVHEDFAPFLSGEETTGTLQLTEGEHAAVSGALARGDVPTARLLMDSLRDPPVAAELVRVGERAYRLAERLGKGRITVTTEHGGLRVPKEPLARFWANLVHVIRNAVDHGLETPAERAATGKPLVPMLHLRASAEPRGTVVIEVSDDGRGVDFDTLEIKARSRGLGQVERHELLFLEGLSSADAVTQTSGRGVGMGAVRAVVEERGGHIEVESERGRGTTFRFCFPHLLPSGRTAPDSRARSPIIG
ncbi:MAG: ATP-binding protein, partial [Myxococcota bacterium]